MRTPTHRIFIGVNIILWGYHADVASNHCQRLGVLCFEALDGRVNLFHLLAAILSRIYSGMFESCVAPLLILLIGMFLSDRGAGQ